MESGVSVGMHIEKGMEVYVEVESTELYPVISKPTSSTISTNRQVLILCICVSSQSQGERQLLVKNTKDAGSSLR